MIMKNIMQKWAPVVMASLSATASGNAQLSGSAAVPTAVAASNDSALDAGLVGHWKLQGDCRDYSGQGNHGVNHGVGLEKGAFDGVGAYIEVPAHPSLKLGTGDFAL